MAELKTKPVKASVAGFIARLADPAQRKDAKALDALMRKATGAKPEMWGPSIIGYGRYTYIYESGRAGDWMAAGFSPRKGTLVVYLMTGASGVEPLLAKLGVWKMGKSCLYFKRLADVDLAVLAKIVAAAYKGIKAKYPAPAAAAKNKSMTKAKA